MHIYIPKLEFNYQLSCIYTYEHQVILLSIVRVLVIILKYTVISLPYSTELSDQYPLIY